MNKSIVLSCVLFFFLIPALAIAQSSSDTAMLKNLNRKFLDAIVQKDTAALSNILADDFMLINPGGAKRNKQDNLLGAMAPNPKVLSVVIDSEAVRLLSADVGLVTAWTSNKLMDDGKELNFKICYMDVYMKRNNRWFAVAAHVTLLN